MSSATSVDDYTAAIGGESLRRSKRDKFHLNVAVMPVTTAQDNVSETKDLKSAEPKHPMTQKHSSRVDSKVCGKPGKRQKKAPQDPSNSDEIDPAVNNVDKLRNYRLNYLRSRKSRIRPESPPSSASPELTIDGERTGNESSPTREVTESPAELIEVLQSAEEQLEEEGSVAKSPSSSNSSCMPSLERQDNVPNGTSSSSLSGVLEGVGKRERKVPLRHQDFISGSDDEEDLESERIHLEQSALNAKEEWYYCDKCPSMFTSRRGIANHNKLHGVDKRFKCALCDFSCDNYKTLHMHKSFHSTASQKESENVAVAVAPAPLSSNVTSALDSNVFAVKQEAPSTPEIKEKTNISISPKREFACSKCPFKARDQKRLDTHFKGHRQPNGYQCSVCLFLSTSAGFLKRHCQLHKPQNYKWPPDYIGIRQTRAPKGVSRSAEISPAEPEQHLKNSANLNLSALAPSPAADKERVRKTTAPTTTTRGKRLQQRPKQFRRQSPKYKYLCGTCRRRFKTHASHMVHRATIHFKRTAEKKYKLLLKERLNMPSTDGSMEQKVDSTDVTVGNDSVAADNMYRCSHCPFICSQKSRLQRHENKHSVKSEHKCTECTFSCRSTVILEQHSRLHQKPAKALQMPGRPKDLHLDDGASTSSSKVEKCSECPYTSRHMCDLREHAKMHVGNREYACGQCTYSTKRAHVLHAHLQLHRAENECISTTPNDVKNGKKAKNHSILRLHGKVVGERIEHNESPIYACQWCPFRTRICSRLFSHHRNHVGTGRFGCGKCSFKTSVERKLREHLKIHPAGAELSAEPVSSAATVTTSMKPVKRINGEYCCQECPFKCENYGKFWNHKQKHKKQSRYTCNLCSYSSGSHTCLAKHREAHNGQNGENRSGTKMEKFIVMKEEDSKESYVVQEKTEDGDMLSVKCGKDGQTYKFNLRRLAIKIPIVKHSELPEPSNLFRCKECPFFGSDEALFKLHEKMHNGRRPYPCNICSFSSLSQESLHRHLSLHLPPLSPRSATQNKKRYVKRRYHRSPETISPDSVIYHCNVCNYRTAREDRFQEHRLEHTRQIQQRLTTSIKRAQNAGRSDEKFVKPKIRRPERRADRQIACSKCSFRCDTIVAFNTHSEKHGAKSFFKCGLCDYSAETSNIVDFHVANHHLDIPISFFYKKAITNPEQSQMILKNDFDTKKYFSQSISCRLCDFKTARLADFTEHWEKKHCDPAQKPPACYLRLAEELRMGMLHTSWIKNVGSERKDVKAKVKNNEVKMENNKEAEMKNVEVEIKIVEAETKKTGTEIANSETQTD